LYSGVPAKWLDEASYPVVVDPDFGGHYTDGYVHGFDISYATARSTSYYHYSDYGWLDVGQRVLAKYWVFRPYLKFDTSSIGSGANIDQVYLKLVCINDYSNVDFYVDIVKCDWSASDPVSSGNRETVYDGILSATKDVTWRNTSGISTGTQYTSPNMDTSWINKTGTTYYGLRSLEDYNNSSPTGEEYIEIGSQNHATPSYRPVLVVEYSTHPTPDAVPLSFSVQTPTIGLYDTRIKLRARARDTALTTKVRNE
jgi:hypothetical protein